MTQSWLFQANPRTFDIDGFLASRPASFLWLVAHSSLKMRIGDRVYLWRAVGGGEPERSGVVAETEIAELPFEQPEDATSRPFWRSGDPTLPKLRVRLRIIRIAHPIKGLIRRDWMAEDPVLGNMTILRMANGTTFFLTDEQATRLDAVWAKTGHAFSYAEAVAALSVYEETYGKQLSMRAGSPVSDMALRLGRVVSSIYRKVLNFRSLDPRDPRKGLSGGGEIDFAVWARFFDAASNTLRTGDLDVEFQRLWSDGGLSASETAAARIEALERAANDLASLSLADLLARYRTSARPPKPRSGAAPVRRFERDPLVVAVAKVRADFRCEVPGCLQPTFLDRKTGRPYHEVHHIQPLGDGGDDTPENTACVCPSHHREAHHGGKAARIKQALMEVRRAGTSGVLVVTMTSQRNRDQQ